MKIYYEESWMNGELLKDDQVIDTKEKLDSFKEGDNLFVQFNSSYHFYETPWERDDQTDVILDLNGVHIKAKGLFRNKTKQFVIRGLSSVG
jgi:hypothetical protein